MQAIFIFYDGSVKFQTIDREHPTISIDSFGPPNWTLNQPGETIRTDFRRMAFVDPYWIYKEMV